MANTWLGLLLGSYLVSSSVLSLYKQPNFHLEFNSFYVDDSKLKMYSLKTNELLPILEIISNKFSKIYTQTIYSQSGLKKHELNIIPEAVALHNNQSRNKIELLMVIDWDSIMSSAKFSQALLAANEANSIYPGSVTYLLAECVDFSKNETIIRKEKVYPYKIGVIISIGNHPEDFFNSRLNPVIENVNLVILDFGNLVGNEMVELKVAQLKLEYKKYREEIKRHEVFKDAEVGVQVKWFSKSANSSDLIEFWIMLNEWSVKNNVKVFLQSAFDDRIKELGYSIGRWKVMGEKRRNIKFEDNFVLEEEELIEDFKSFNSTSEKSEEDSKMIFPVVGSVSAFMFGLVLLIMYRRARIKGCLTRQEISEFYKGSESFRKYPNKDGEHDGISSIEREGYKKEFEVDKGSYKLSDCLLGSGAFGEVWKGIVIKAGVEVDVAAKALKRGCRTSALKGFLSEMKVMAYLGKHKNLVGMVGAYTKGLERGKVIIFTELCENGSLESYLRNLGKNLVCESGCKDAKVDLFCLHRWCSEIANGMGYLSSKNVVHADLATRNVLLNDELTAKISDFGLSRRLYDYTIYVKKKRQQEEPLPWKWMSPESLQRLEFNEKTDVWAFGVTMWEIYSLGNTPYPGLNWTVDFPTKLVKGLRMEKPVHDNGEMYILMVKCWNVDPAKRPTFSELSTSIQSMELKPVHDKDVMDKELNDGNKPSDNYIEI